MKILHTADWHLGDRLGRIDRTDDLRGAVERVADYCKTETVDVLLVAGDLFSELARPDGLRETIRHWQEVFREFLETGGTILTLTGNHDNENFCQTLVHAMSLASPAGGKPGETVPPGRLYLAADPTFLRLEDRALGGEVQFVLMPYPTPSHYLKGEGALKYGSPEEKNTLLVNAWAEALREIRAHPRYDAKAPAVLGGARSRSRIERRPESLPPHERGRCRCGRRGAAEPVRLHRAGAHPQAATRWREARPLLRQHRAHGPRRAGRSEGRRARRDRAGWFEGRTAGAAAAFDADLRRSGNEPGRRPPAAEARISRTPKTTS